MNREARTYAPKYAVNAVTCGHSSRDEEVYERLKDATNSLERSWKRLESAKSIAIKFNQDLEREYFYLGQRRELVCDSVARAVLRLLRERTDADLFCADASYFKIAHEADPAATTNIAPVLEEFGVNYLDCADPPVREVNVPGGGAMFDFYGFRDKLLDADEVVSVAKMKNHSFMGVTGCLKNLFGLVPGCIRPRHYYPHLVRMPYMLADIGKILDPALNVIDAMIAQPGREWADKNADGITVDTLIAGDNATATDACMTWLMGHDPDADWLVPPFLRDRNPLRVARKFGFGMNLLDEIDFTCEPTRSPEGVFYSVNIDPIPTIISWRRSMCEQALNYRDNLDRYLDYRDQFVLIQRGEVKWSSPDGLLEKSRRALAGNHAAESLYLKYVDPDEKEREHYEVYEDALADLENRGT